MRDAGKEHAPVGRSVDGYKNGAAQAGKALDITKARLKIADVDMTKPVSPDACAVTFQVQLKAGLTQLQSWLTEGDGTSHGAYYVYVKRLAR